MRAMQMGAGGPSELRREPRLPVRVRAALLVYRNRYEVTIVDLSNNGAMVTGEGALPEKGDEVVLAQGTFEAVATVAWSIGANVGLTFHKGIDANVVARRLRDAGRVRVKH